MKKIILLLALLICLHVSCQQKPKDAATPMKESAQNNISPCKQKLPYNKRINIRDVKYETFTKNPIGADQFLCGDELLRYIPLPNKNSINVVLVPLDCGDFPYRFFLLTIKNDTIISNLYVEGEWSYPEDATMPKEVTSFSIDKDYTIKVQTRSKKKIIKQYQIQDDGKIIKIK